MQSSLKYVKKMNQIREATCLFMIVLLLQDSYKAILHGQ